MTEQERLELIRAFHPFREALNKNDTDTIGIASSDDTHLFELSGSWTGTKIVTIGNLRKLAKAVSALTEHQSAGEPITHEEYWKPHDDMLAEGACQVCHGSCEAIAEGEDDYSECWNCGGSGDASDGDFEFIERSIGAFNFKRHGGETVVDGKLRWPHHMRIHLTKDEAFELAMELLNSVKNQRWDGDISIAMLGELTRDAEEDDGREIESK